MNWIALFLALMISPATSPDGGNAPATAATLTHFSNNSNCSGHFYPGPISIADSNSVGTVIIGAITEISFNFKASSPTWTCASGWCHILKIGTSKYVRLPLISIQAPDQHLHVPYTGLPDLYVANFNYTSTQNMLDGNEHSFYFKYTSTQSMFIFDGITILNKTSTVPFINPQIGDKYGIWVCDSLGGPQYPANGYISNLCVNSEAIKTRTISCGSSHSRYISDSVIHRYEFSINSTQNVQFDSCQTQADIVVVIKDMHTFDDKSSSFCDGGDYCGEGACVDNTNYYPENFIIPGLIAGVYEINIRLFNTGSVGTYHFTLSCMDTASPTIGFPTTSPITHSPTVDPTDLPTDLPTNFPTVDPTYSPTTNQPTLSTREPTLGPTRAPIAKNSPTHSPTPTPTREPTPSPTDSPTHSPTPGPTTSPTSAPIPTLEPTTLEPTPPPVEPPTYDGPVSNEYFKFEFNKTVDELPEIKCNDVYNNRTNIWNPVVYYKVIVTEEMQNRYKSILQISSCCEFQKHCGQDDRFCNVNIWAKRTMGCTEINCGELRKYVQPYNHYCDNSSLDTILYILYEKKGKIVLLDSFDDSSKSKCKTTEKSVMNLFDYNDGQYIIGVGGFGKEFGSFTIKMSCTAHSYPVQQHELNPSINDNYKGSITCDQTNHTQSDSMMYYRFDLTQTSYFPITITACLTYSESRIYVIKRSENNDGGYDTIDKFFMVMGGTNHPRSNAESILCDDMSVEYSSIITSNVIIQSQSVTFDLTENMLSNVNHFYIAIQPQPGSALKGKVGKDARYIYLQTECAPAPTAPPTTSPTRDPSISPTIDPTKDPTTGTPTNDPTASPTHDYSYPMKSNEFKIQTDYPNIKCDDTLTEQINIYESLVSYYQFNIDTIYKPSYITVCASGANAYQSVISVFKLNDNDEVIIHDAEYEPDKKCKVYVHSMNKGDYYAVIQGINNSVGVFTIEMNCAEAKIPREMVIGLVFGISGCFALGFFIWYLRQWKQYKDDKKNKRTSIPQQEDGSDSEILQLQTQRTTTNVQLVPLKSSQTNVTNVIQHEEDSDSNNGTNQTTQNQQSVNTNTDNDDDDLNRMLDADKDIYVELDKDSDEDVVQRVIRHAIACCDDQEGLDIYQVLAIRWYDYESRHVRGTRPFKRIGWNIEVVSISPFVRSLLITMIIGFAQTMGISIVIYKLLTAYFEDGSLEEICKMEASRWEKVFSLRILSFTLSLIVTCYISIAMGAIQHSGLYEIVDRLKPEHIQEIDQIALWLLYVGQSINYYVCLVAVLGSYFIIFETNKGDDGDYSHAGSDMILNAVALFFMLQLDDEIVSSQDYNDCSDHLKEVVLKKVQEKHLININEEYREDNQDDKGCACECRSAPNARCSQFMYRSITVFAIVAKVCCYVGGFIAPFIIFFCW